MELTVERRLPEIESTLTALMTVAETSLQATPIEVMAGGRAIASIKITGRGAEGIDGTGGLVVETDDAALATTIWRTLDIRPFFRSRSVQYMYRQLPPKLVHGHISVRVRFRWTMSCITEMWPHRL